MKIIKVMLLITSTILASCEGESNTATKKESTAIPTNGLYNPLSDKDKAKGMTPMMLAAAFGDSNAIKALLKQGAQVEARDMDGWTALHYATAGGDGPLSGKSMSHREALETLLDAGANINARTTKGDVALTLAARKGQVEWVRVLIDRGADVNAKDSVGSTALIDAAQFGHSDEEATEVVRMLLSAGADVSVKDGLGQTALQVAKEEHRSEMVALLRKAGRINH
jgi:ankyrin repeat protein